MWLRLFVGFLVLGHFAQNALAQFPGVTCQNRRLGPIVGAGSNVPYGTKNGTLSSDGNFVSFSSASTDLIPSLTPNLSSQVYYWDRSQNSLQMLSLNSSGAPGNNHSDFPYVSRSGQFVVFSSQASNLDPSDNNGTNDVFFSIPVAQVTVRMSTDSAGNELSGHHFYPSISDDGSRILFISTNDSILPGDNNGATDVFLKETGTGAIYRISKNGVPFAGVQNPNMQIHHAEISADGRSAIFSTQTNILGEANFSPDIFFVDLSDLNNIPAPIPVSSQWNNRTLPAGGAVWGSISGDGQRVVFSSSSHLHVQGDIQDQRDDLFVWERSTQEIRKINPPFAPTVGFTPTYFPKISFNGRWITVLSYSYAWDPSVTREEKDTLLYDLETDRFEILSRYFGGTGLEDEAVALTAQSSGKPVSDDGKTTLFETESNRVIPNWWSDSNGRTDVFVAECSMPDYPTVCAGDGSSGPCPASSLGYPGCGCPNSANIGGAKLEGIGFANITNDLFKVKISGAPANTPLCLAASFPNPNQPLPLGFGLKCIGDPYVAGFTVLTDSRGNYSFGYGSTVHPSLGALIGYPNTLVTYQAFFIDTIPGQSQITPVNSTNAINVYWNP